MSKEIKVESGQLWVCERDCSEESHYFIKTLLISIGNINGDDIDIHQCKFLGGGYMSTITEKLLRKYFRNIPLVDGKEFDINEYEFSDENFGVSYCQCDDLSVTASISLGECGVIIHKQDAIALAKHFKLTAEDLK